MTHPHAGRTVPTPRELAAWRAHLETFEQARARIEAALHRDSGLSSGDYTVMLALGEAPEHAMRSSDLAAHIGWERSRLSGQLGRMERRGLIRREACAEDARGSRTVLTAAGARAFRDATVPHLRAIRAVFVDAFTPAELTRIHEDADTLRAHLDRLGPR
ncbi:MarR family winged helix-turn-helix transcriptional regulator [Brachybacterium sp. AOP25-B2-12]|uniref:MarR family winged helix-turn-helix transcriptional regulator n=1 Tax=Brachybacterium sp. AOP25-B2-12 TaxID=3457710 RepID=UPI004033C615